jgi:hypothetical protein
VHGNVMAFTCSLFIITENEWMADTCWQVINFWCKFPFFKCKKSKVGLSLSLSLAVFPEDLIVFLGPFAFCLFAFGTFEIFRVLLLGASFFRSGRNLCVYVACCCFFSIRNPIFFFR